MHSFLSLLSLYCTGTPRQPTPALVRLSAALVCLKPRTELRLPRPSLLAPRRAPRSSRPLPRAVPSGTATTLMSFPCARDPRAALLPESLDHAVLSGRASERPSTRRPGPRLLPRVRAAPLRITAPGGPCRRVPRLLSLRPSPAVVDHLRVRAREPTAVPNRHILRAACQSLLHHRTARRPAALAWPALPRSACPPPRLSRAGCLGSARALPRPGVVAQAPRAARRWVVRRHRVFPDPNAPLPPPPVDALCRALLCGGRRG